MSESDRPYTAASFRAFLDEGKLMGSRCVDTGEIFIPPRAMCPRTYSTNMEWVVLSGKATLVAFTAIYIGTTPMIAAGFDRTRPYLTGIVELEEGPRFSAEILGLDGTQPDLAWIGRPLQAAFVERGEGDQRHTHLAFE